MEPRRPRLLPLPRAAATAILALALAASAAAAAPDPAGPRTGTDLMAYLHSGLALPVHPAEFDEFWHLGWNVGAGIGVPVAPEWEITVQFQYQHHGADESRQKADLLLSGPGGIVAPVASIDGRDLSVLTLMAEARFLVPSARPSPTWFLAFGFGVGSVSTSDALVTAEDPGLEPVTVLGDSDTAFATSFGGGVEIDLSGSLRLTVDSIYTLVFTEQTSTQFLPLRLGLARRFR